VAKAKVDRPVTKSAVVRQEDQAVATAMGDIPVAKDTVVFQAKVDKPVVKTAGHHHHGEEVKEDQSVAKDALVHHIREEVKDEHPVEEQVKKAAVIKRLSAALLRITNQQCDAMHIECNV
jgi:hypothetical protein